MVDGSSDRFTTPIRLAKLTSLQAGWRTFNRASPVALLVDHAIPTYDLQKGVLTLGCGGRDPWVTRSLRYHRFHSRINEIERHSWRLNDFGKDIRDFTTDPAQDLVVILEELDEEDPHVCRLHLRTMSTGIAHPLAKDAVVTGRTSYLARDVEGSFSYVLVLRGKLLAVNCTLMSEDQAEKSTDLWIWDWTSGDLVYRQDSSLDSAFSFLDDNSFVLAINDSTHGQTDGWWLDVHFIRRNTALPSTPVRFILPGFRPGELTSVTKVLLRSNPNDCSLPAQQHPTESSVTNGARGPRVFYTSPSNRILLLSCIVTSRGRRNMHAGAAMDASFSIVIQADSLHAAALDQWRSRRDTRSKGSEWSRTNIRWEQWGPSTTRWIRKWVHNSFVNDVNGQRCIFGTVGPGEERAVSVMDFNRYAVRRDTTSPSAAPLDGWEFGDRVQTRLVTESTCIAMPYIFTEPIVSSLPYRETFYPVGDALDNAECAFCLDEERIWLVRVRPLVV
ncbi:hypothetical protein FRB97_004558 [Tulasnella sp. 331]|nr:hypothetical protein FRB97_004558 [Tulasnella sp. 331]